MSIVSEVSEKPAIRSRPGPTSRRGRRKTGTNTGTGPLGWFLLVVLAVYAGGPLVVFLFNSLKSPAEISNSPLGAPTEWRWENFVTAFQDANMGQGILNSLIISVSTAVGVCVIAGLAAYAMTRLDLPGKNNWMLYLLVSTSLPIQMFLVPLLTWWSTLGLYNSQFGLIVIYWAIYSPFATLLLRSFLIAIPPQYEEAARIDGAGEFRLFTSIVVPMIWPGFITAALVAGLQAYNEFLLAVTFIQDADRLPASLALYSFQQNLTPNWALVSAAGLIMALPAIVIFIFLQRKFIEGYTQGGMAN
ncbi:carbohydrate ABC transporter permease [Microterricola viridarii]|uniref:Carbohydrate ABC transporter membrane protein 2, CUT1 family n=1 Tax=Microterricola viridarii TaxID=412690 RepID=A0A1H1NDK5_9MICO|nr:carbohydrate ABC transporter permease [Microterricola viridarii]SDR96910.1 carbohydrate ABC transporter membrane protein 2, CUT1 family [Microterricola viridarii]